MLIKVEEIPAEEIENCKAMMEITDKNILTYIDNLVPGLMQVGNAVNNANQETTKLYKAIIPAGATLDNSRAMKNAKRGTYHGEKGIKGHADFVEVNQSKKLITNIVSSGTGIASMIIGEYYMKQINDEISRLNDEISKISRFQNDEYGSKVLALLVQIKRISLFQAEIIENESLRNSDIDKLNFLEQSTIELLGQANLAISDTAKKYNLDYKKYEEELNEIHKWHIYQKNLLEVLYKITELKNVLYLGKISKEQLNFTLKEYTKQVMNVHESLIAWHKKTIEKLEIDTENARRKRIGLDGAAHWVPGLFNEDLNFISIPKETIGMIEEQSSNYELSLQYINEEIFNKDAKVISKDGRLYYLL